MAIEGFIDNSERAGSKLSANLESIAAFKLHGQWNADHVMWSGGL